MRILSLLIALGIVNVVWLMPSWILAGRLGSPWITLEAAAVVGLFALTPPGPWRRVAATATALVVVAVALIGLGDTTTRESLARPLNFYSDAYLLSSVYRLLVGTLGTPAAWAVTGAFLVGTAALVALVATVLGATRRDEAPPRHVRFRARRETWLGVTLVVLVLVALVLVGPWRVALPALDAQVALPATRLLREQTRYFMQMWREHERFSSEMAAAPARYDRVPGLLAGLGQRDVVLAFIESYGISAVDDPRYAPMVRPRLDDFAARMHDAELVLATGLLTAPTQGGQSWLSHLSMLSGLWIDNQLRYDLTLTSDHETLVDDFRRAAYHTVAVMPATTLAWPEGEEIGYDTIYAHRDITYRGPPLNWVTMPDQFTWSFLEQTVRGGTRDRPLFVELALISSHAPWTPILPVLDDWHAIGDGSVFASWKDAGERPQDLWRDPDRVRQHYALAIDYALNVMTGWAERYVDDDTLLIVLGDHQPAPLVTGDNASRDVPIHVVSTDRALIEPFLAWGFIEGAHPARDGPVHPMNAFRDWFVHAFSGTDQFRE